MSLQNIKLPFATIANLYSAPLIQLTETSSESKPAVKFLGSNQKQITILVNVTNAPFLQDAAFNFLTGILSACKLTIADVAILNLNQLTNRHYQQIQEVTSPTVMLLFGLSPSDIELPVQFPEFQVQRYAGVSYLAAPPLEMVEGDKAIKAKLWMSLKSAFQL